MRQFEVRAWDKKNNCMCEVTAIDFEDESVCVDTWFCCWLIKDDHELMQWTGLLDKNGVKIFEGDIVVINDIEDLPYTIRYIGGAYEMQSIKRVNVKFLLLSYTTSNIKIIGNIFENPELLGGANNDNT